MVQVINDPNRKTIGESAVSGLSSLLQGLAHSKAQDLHRNRAVKELKSAYPDLPEGALGFLASQPPKEQQMYLQNFSQNMENMRQQQIQQQQLREQMRNQALEQLQFKQQQPTVPYAPGFQGPKQPEYGGKQQKETQQLIQELQRQPVKQRAQPAEQQSLSRSTAQVGKAGFTPYQKAQLDLEQQKLLEKKQQLKTKEGHQQQQEINKETKKYYDNLLAQNEAADKSDKRLKHMERLIDKGDLPISTFYKIFKNMEEAVPTPHGAAAGGALGAALGSVLPGLGTVVGGLAGATIGGLISPIGTLLRDTQRLISPDTEEFEKLSISFIDQAKAIFGSRITDIDLKTFLATIPTLANTDHGKRQIINNIRVFNEAVRVKTEAMKRIIKENGGKRPENLQILVEERAKPELDKLDSQFEWGAGLTLQPETEQP